MSSGAEGTGQISLGRRLTAEEYVA